MYISTNNARKYSVDTQQFLFLNWLGVVSPLYPGHPQVYPQPMGRKLQVAVWPEDDPDKGLKHVANLTRKKCCMSIEY